MIPVVRDCICPTRPRVSGEHTDACAEAYLAKLWRAVKAAKAVR